MNFCYASLGFGHCLQRGCGQQGRCLRKRSVFCMLRQVNSLQQRSHNVESNRFQHAFQCKSTYWCVLIKTVFSHDRNQETHL
jgi:hypothetical protein